MRVSSALLLTLVLAGSAPAQQADTSAIKTTAYLDARVGELIRLARERRRVADVSVESYTALSKERVSVGLRGIRRDRLLYRREVAGRLQWNRSGGGKIEIIGAREAVPVAIKNVQLPSDLGTYMPHLAFDPADNRMLIGWKDNDFVRHPLAPDAEKYYQYRTGNVTSIQLPNGKVVRLIELEVIPRRTDSHNVSGSFWLDADTHAIVRAGFRLAKDIDILRDLDDDDDDLKEMPGFLKPLTATVDYVTIDYSLYDLKWWMPRSVMFEGSMRIGFMKVPMQYERSYSNYQVVGSETPVMAPIAEVITRDSINQANSDSCNNRMTVSIGGKNEEKGVKISAGKMYVQCGRWEIAIPTDTAALLNSKELPANVFATGEQLVTEGELRELGQRIEKLGGGPSVLPQPVTDFSWLSVTQARYNRVEGLSVAGRGGVDFGAYKATAVGRIGIADREPNVEIAIDKIGQNHTITLGGYRRLNAMDPWARPFSFGSSLSALLFGRDDADYYRTIGGELKIEPSGANTRWYALRLYSQHETPVSKNTDASLRRAFNNDYTFRPNLQADRETEHGAELTLRYNHGLDPEGIRFGAELYGNGAIGTNDYGRAALTLRSAFPLPGSFSGALEGAAGLTSVDAPLQHQWYLGSANSLRGYPGSVISGEAFWRGRGEIGYGLPAVRLVGFSDVAWAGARDDYKIGKPLVSVGAGASFLDGIIRFDVARGLREPKGWSAMLYFDAAL